MFQLLYEKNVSVFPTGLSVRGPVCWVSFGDFGLLLCLRALLLLPVSGVEGLAIV